MRLIHFIAGALVVGLAACSAPKVDRSSAPAAGPAPQINIGKYETFTLDNGLKVIVVENNKLPRVSYSITVDRGPLFEGDRAGYASFAGGLMSAGTTNRTKAEIDAATDFIGASMSTSATGVFGS
jgi:predicted Zn-dependent peptidase